MPFKNHADVMRQARADLPGLVESAADGDPRACMFHCQDEIAFALFAIPGYLVPVFVAVLDSLNDGLSVENARTPIPTDPERN